MVFKRRGGFRKFRKFKRFRRKVNPGIIALRRIKNMIQIKYNDLNIVQTPSSDVPHVSSMVSIAQGTGDQQRVGDKILVHSIFVRGHYQLATDLTSIQRMLIVVDKQQVASSSPVLTSILSSNSMQAALNLSTAGRFRVLMDKTDVLMPPSADVNTKKYIYRYIKLRKPIPVRWNSTTGASIQMNGIWAIWYSDRAAASNPATASFDIRVGYTDG